VIANAVHTASLARPATSLKAPMAGRHCVVLIPVDAAPSLKREDAA
jgi:hypothetical protein